MTYYPAGSYEQQMLDFTEEIRTTFGFGYGEGHQFSDMLRVIKARNDVYLKLTAAEASVLMNRPNNHPMHCMVQKIDRLNK